MKIQPPSQFRYKTDTEQRLQLYRKHVCIDLLIKRTKNNKTKIQTSITESAFPAMKTCSLILSRGWMLQKKKKKKS